MEREKEVREKRGRREGRRTENTRVSKMPVYHKSLF